MAARPCTQAQAPEAEASPGAVQALQGLRQALQPRRFLHPAGRQANHPYPHREHVFHDIGHALGSGLLKRGSAAAGVRPRSGLLIFGRRHCRDCRRLPRGIGIFVGRCRVDHHRPGERRRPLSRLPNQRRCKPQQGERVGPAGRTGHGRAPDRLAIGRRLQHAVVLEHVEHGGVVRRDAIDAL